MTYGLHTKQVMVGALLLNVIACGALGFLVMTMTHTKNDIAKLETVRNERATAVGSLISLRSLVRETEGLRGTLDSFFLKEENAVTFIESLETLAARGGVTFQISAADPDLSNKLAPSLKLAMNIGGDFDHVTRFAGLLEQLPLRAEVTFLSIRETGVSETPYQATLRMTVKSFIPRTH